jgi:hypothetical protein
LGGGSQKLDRRILIVVVAVATLFVGYRIFWNIRSAVRKAEVSTTYAYLQSVCAAIDSYHESHGAYPISLSLLEPGSTEPFDLDLPLQSLTYQRSPAGYRLSYNLGYQELECPLHHSPAAQQGVEPDVE